MNEVDPVALVTVEDYEKAAKRVLPKMAYDYYRSGADEERTLKANRKAFRNYEVWYRVLVDVSQIDTSATILGQKVASPILIAPTAYHKLAHPEGESATARAAAEAGTIMTVSTLATTRLEDVASASTGPKWFQLYVHKDRDLTSSLVKRAEQSGYKAIVLTVDAPVLGRRLADHRNQFVLPEGLAMENLAESDVAPTEPQGSMLAEYVGTRHDASLSWTDLDHIKSLSGLPLLIKGIVRPDDARRAVDAGVDGIIVSNHGGRQLDGAPAAIDALVAVAAEVKGETTLLMDGGIRSGVDVLKAIALGAGAVLVGRPVLWGLAVAGQAGVLAVLQGLNEELVTAMKLAGCPDVASIDESLIVKR